MIAHLFQLKLHLLIRVIAYIGYMCDMQCLVKWIQIAIRMILLTKLSRRMNFEFKTHEYWTKCEMCLMYSAVLYYVHCNATINQSIFTCPYLFFNILSNWNYQRTALKLYAFHSRLSIVKTNCWKIPLKFPVRPLFDWNGMKTCWETNVIKMPTNIFIWNAIDNGF